MLRIRLKRTGSRNQPSYRIVVADSKKPRDGRVVEQICHYNPRLDPPEVVIDREKAVEWVRKGAQPSEAVPRMIDQSNDSDSEEN